MTRCISNLLAAALSLASLQAWALPIAGGAADLVTNGSIDRVSLNGLQPPAPGAFRPVVPSSPINPGGRDHGHRPLRQRHRHAGRPARPRDLGVRAHRAAHRPHRGSRRRPERHSGEDLRPGARSGASGRRAPRRRRAGAPARSAHDPEGIHPGRRPAPERGHPGLQTLRARRRRPARPGGVRCRRGAARQDQHPGGARRLAGRQPGLRAHQQPLGPGTHPRRQHRRRRRGPGRRA
jgi:hypothetical protein